MLQNKTIHYCWFGGGPLSEAAKNDIESWRKFAPEYEIKRWDETNIDLSDCPFAVSAYKSRKWAFVSDYVRYKVIYEHGGIYFDVGTELIRPLVPLEDVVPFSAMEYFSKTVNSGLVLAANAGDPWMAEILEIYRNMEFEDDPIYLSQHTVNETMTNVFERHGFIRECRGQKVGDWTILDPDVFGPVFGFGGFHIKPNTVSLHHYSGSWGTNFDRQRGRYELALTPFIGRRPAQIVSRIMAEFRVNGLIEGIKNLYAKVKSD